MRNFNILNTDTSKAVVFETVATTGAESVITLCASEDIVKQKEIRRTKNNNFLIFLSPTKEEASLADFG